MIYCRGCRRLGGIFDFELKSERLAEVNRELEQPDVWNNPEMAARLNQERAALAAVVEGLVELDEGLSDSVS